MQKENLTKKLIAIQGGYGSFHEIASREYFGDNNIEIMPCDTFPEVCEACKNGKASYGIMAIENTVSGSLVFNYSLLQEYMLNIEGEIYLRIEQNLMALPGESISDIKEVYSHHMAIAQTRVFFRDYPHIKLIESTDTALSAKEISEKKLKNTGAIADSSAAKMYELEIIQRGIETNKKNYTRFLVMDNKEPDLNPDKEKTNKSSLVFMLPHTKGSLSQVLSILSFYEINLTKIQSLPIIGKEWEYLFYIDLIFEDYIRYRQAVEAIRPLISELRILGEYTKGKRKLNGNNNSDKQNT
ncbi:prephenate dehydratase [Bacteroidota bacterium]